MTKLFKGEKDNVFLFAQDQMFMLFSYENRENSLSIFVPYVPGILKCQFSLLLCTIQFIERRETGQSKAVM